VRRADRLVFADAFRAGPAIRGRLQGTATLNRMRARAAIVYVAPDAEARLAMARMLLPACGGAVAASAWDGILLVRMAAADGQTLTADMARFLTGFRGAAVPRSWSC
jgi:urease accessory protein